MANSAEDSFSPLFRSRGPGSAIIEALRIVNSEENLILKKVENWGHQQCKLGGDAQSMKKEL